MGDFVLSSPWNHKAAATFWAFAALKTKGRNIIRNLFLTDVDKVNFIYLFNFITLNILSSVYNRHLYAHYLQHLFLISCRYSIIPVSFDFKIAIKNLGNMGFLCRTNIWLATYCGPKF